MADTTEQSTTETEPTTTEVPTEEKKEEEVVDLTEEKKEEEVPPTEEQQQQEPHEDEAEAVQVEVERRYTNDTQKEKKVGVKEGYLHKQGGKFKTWKKRYFVLLETSITYFDKLNGKIKGGILNETITGVRASNPNETKKPFAFTIDCGTDRPYIQVGADSADMEAWMEAILKIVPESQLTPVEEPKKEEDTIGRRRERQREKEREKERERERERERNIIVKGFPTEKATERLLARAGKAINHQREMFTDEVFEDNVSAMEYLRIAKGVASEQTLTVVSFNTYYSRIADKTKKDVINPDITFKAAFAMLEAGVDVLCLQEVVFGEDAQSGGKDEYNFDFFGKAEFDAHGPAIENLKNKIKNMGYTFIDAAANPSTMYRKRFGNAVIVNTNKFEIVNQHVVPALLGPAGGNDPEGRSAAMFHLKLKSNSSEVFVVNTHLTERQVGANGERQTKMMIALVKQLSVFKGRSTAPTIIAGDMNINQSQELPNTMARICEKNEFLSVKPENYPFTILKSNGFKSLQTIACGHDQVLSSCWNSAVVDYIGANGNLTPLFVGTLPPLYQGWRISDHSFPVAVYKLYTFAQRNTLHL